MSRNHDSATLRLTLSALLVTVMLVLGYVESLIPSPVAGVKLGLSNSVLIFAVCLLDTPTAFTLMALKVGLSGVLFSGVMGMLYAYAGGLLSLTGMALLHRIRKLPLPAVSMAGGLLHNAGQLGMAMLVTNLGTLGVSLSLGLYIAVLAVSGLVCGLLTGVAAERVIHHTKNLRPVRQAGADGQRMSLRRRGIALVICALVVIAVGVMAVLGQPRDLRGVETENPPVVMTDGGEKPF